MTFDPAFNCPTHFASGDALCPACIAKQPGATEPEKLHCAICGWELTHAPIDGHLWCDAKLCPRYQIIIRAPEACASCEQMRGTLDKLRIVAKEWAVNPKFDSVDAMRRVGAMIAAFDAAPK